MKAQTLGIVAGAVLTGLSLTSLAVAGGAHPVTTSKQLAAYSGHGYQVCYSRTYRYIRKFRWYKRYIGYGQYRWTKVYYGGYYRPYYRDCRVKPGYAPCYRGRFGWYPTYHQARRAVKRCRHFYANSD